MPTKRTFKTVNEQVVEDIKRELRLQGHYLTGALEASLIDKELSQGGTIVLTAEALAYLEELEKGVPREQIVINSKILDEMTRYVELRMGYRGRKAVRVANLILKKQKRQGKPTWSSDKYSQTGKRTQAVEETFERNQDRYISGIDREVLGSLDESFHEIKSGVI
jgi:hypothetical protein